MARGARGGREICGGRAAEFADDMERDEVAQLRQEMETMRIELRNLRAREQRHGPSPTRFDLLGEETVSVAETDFGNPFHVRRREFTDDTVRRWESGFKVDLPEFHGGVQGDEFSKWLVITEESLDFKGVPDHKRVGLVVTRFRGRAASWWQYHKLTRTRQGKDSIGSWEKLKKHVRAAFLPHNYVRTVYQQFQNLSQGARSIDDYTKEFYALVVRCDVMESEEHTVSQYIGGLRSQFQDVLNMFDLFSVSEAHQKAVLLEKQFTRRTGMATWSNTPRNTPIPSRATGPNLTTTNPNPTLPIKQTKTDIQGGIRCFKSGERGHRAVECRKSDNRGKNLLIQDDNQSDEGVDPNPNFDASDSSADELVAGDIGPPLVTRRVCLTPRAPDGDGWLRNNVFQSSCTIGSKVCKLIFDPGSCENVVSEDVMRKLNLTTEKHPRPYKLSWLDKGTDVTVSERCLVSFSIGLTYKDQVWSDVVSMDAGHLLLGRPWECDRYITHDGRANTYNFKFNGVKLKLLPRKEVVPETLPKKGNNLLTLTCFESDMEQAGVVFAIMGVESSVGRTIPDIIKPLVDEFSDVFSK